MLMASKEKEKERGKKHQQRQNNRPAAAAQVPRHQTWEDVARLNPFAGRESMMNHSQKINSIPRTAVGIPFDVVNQPINQANQDKENEHGVLESNDDVFPSYPAQLTEGEPDKCRQQRRLDGDIFANAGTNEMGARLPPPPGDDNDDDAEANSDDEDKKGPCQEKHEAANYKKVLMCVLLGLQDEDDRKLGDLSVEPNSSMRQKSLFAPVSEDLRLKVLCQAEHNGTKPMPKPSWWSEPKLQQWLIDNPVEAERDVTFLIETKAKVRAEIEDEIKEREAMLEDRVKSNGNWCNMYPFLHLCCCMCDDRAQEALLTKDDGWDRQELDARNQN